MNSDHSAFLAAIISAPNDDLPRLIYADYLDERGEAERAEFIRLQINMARCRMCHKKDGTERKDSYAEHCGRCKPGRKREEKLIYGPHDRSWHEWVPKLDGFGFNLNYPDPITSSAPSAKFRRGFVEEITCSWEDWRTHADAIRASTPLRKVKLTTWPTFSDRRMWGGLATVETAQQATRLFTAWPGIEFELPQPSNPAYIQRDFADLFITGNLAPDDPRTISVVGDSP